MRRAPSQLKDALFGLSSAVVGRGCYVVLQAVLARCLGPRDYGLYAIGWTVAGLLSTFAALGMPKPCSGSDRRPLGAPLLPCFVAGAGTVVVAAGSRPPGRPDRGQVFGEPGAAP